MKALYTKERPTVLYDGATWSPTPVPGGVHILGIPFDGTACFKKGTVDGPDAVREVSRHLETWSPYLHRDAEAMEPLYELGNFIPALWTFTGEHGATLRIFEDLGWVGGLREAGTRFCMIGGEHSVSYGALRAVLASYEDLCVIHLDAHADLRDGYEGYTYSHAAVMRRAMEHFGPGHRLLQGQIRSGTHEEFAMMDEKGTLVPTIEALLDELAALPEGTPLYLTLDVDWFDPSAMPGTGTAEPGGYTFREFLPILRALNERNFVGCDVVELSPSLDPTGISSVLASKVVRELLLALSSQRTI